MSTCPNAPDFPSEEEEQEFWDNYAKKHPCGECEPKEHYRLQADINNLCKPEKGNKLGCREATPQQQKSELQGYCEEQRRRKNRNEKCLKAREKIKEKCYPKDPETEGKGKSHRLKREATQENVDHCQFVIDKFCGGT